MSTIQLNWTIGAPGGEEHIYLDGNGFFGFYVGGTHAYKIIDSSSNTLTLKTVGFEGLAWYIILTNEQ